MRKTSVFRVIVLAPAPSRAGRPVRRLVGLPTSKGTRRLGVRFRIVENPTGGSTDEPVPAWVEKTLRKRAIDRVMWIFFPALVVAAGPFMDLPAWVFVGAAALIIALVVSVRSILDYDKFFTIE